MKGYYLFVLLSACILCRSICWSSSPTFIYPVSDFSEAKLPRNLRKVDHPHFTKPSLNLQGLSELRISGSAQFSQKTFIAMIHTFSVSLKDLVVLDLREESHGFINGDPISWTDGNNYANVNKTHMEIAADELMRLQQALNAKEMMIDPIKRPTHLIVQSIMTEQELVEGAGAIYVRLPVTDHKRPDDEIVDMFIDFVSKMSSDDWVHMHCKGGRGRTTTFLTLFDIAKNGKDVSLDDILARQFLIGGIDLTEVNKDGNEKSDSAKDRLEFIQRFYLYCQEVPDFHIKWSEWVMRP